MRQARTRSDARELRRCKFHQADGVLEDDHELTTQNEGLRAAGAPPARVGGRRGAGPYSGRAGVISYRCQGNWIWLSSLHSCDAEMPMNGTNLLACRSSFPKGSAVRYRTSTCQPCRWTVDSCE